jgi:hypothetical protein
MKTEAAIQAGDSERANAVWAGAETRRERRLLETMPARAIDFRPRLARAIDALSALREGEEAEVFVKIAMRAREWARAG